jgi:hypothetical protein
VTGRTSDATTHRGIPVTTVPRTLVDLGSLLSLEALARACHEAGVKYRTTPRQVEAVLARRPNAPGAKKLRQVLHGDAPVTLSALERRFLKLLREANLPLPVTNRAAWELDRRREREARTRGDEFRRYTYGDVFDSPGLTLSELSALLAV